MCFHSRGSNPFLNENTQDMTDFEEKIEYSLALIRKGEKLALALNPTDGYVVGFSGGKDSQVLLDLVKRSGVKYVAHYSVTSNDPPENVYFIREHYPDVKFLHHERNFFRLMEIKGLPTVFHRFCCEKLKENVGAGSVVLTGVRAAESAKRAKYPELNIYSRRKEHADRTQVRTLESVMENEHKCIKGKDKVMLYPILKWSEDDVWRYIKKNNLPVNPCYSKVGRVGCMFCPFSRREELQMYETRYPKFKDLFLRSLKVYLDKRTEPDKYGLRTPEDYYEWWKSKKPVERYAKERGLI